MQKYTKTETVDIKYSTLKTILSEVDEIIKENPQLTYNDFSVEYDTEYQYGDRTVLLHLSYQRYATPKEVEQIKATEKALKESVMKRELETLKQLKKKYAD